MKKDIDTIIAIGVAAVLIALLAALILAPKVASKDNRAQDFQEGFMEGCMGGEAAWNVYCECAYDEISTSMTLEQIERLVQEDAADEEITEVFSDAMNDMVGVCRKYEPIRLTI